MKVTFQLPASRAAITAALEGLTALNAVLIRERDLPSLHDSGVRYVREKPGQENWQNADQLQRTKRGDCEDLAAYEAAYLRVHFGIPALAIAKRTGGKQFHAVVRLPDGTMLDPSLRLGMKRKKKR